MNNENSSKQMSNARQRETSSRHLRILSHGIFPLCYKKLWEYEKKNPSFSFHEFPCDHIFRLEWIRIIEKNGGFKDNYKQKVEKGTRDCCVCNVHFEASCYSDSGRLKQEQCPSIFPSLISK